MKKNTWQEGIIEKGAVDGCDNSGSETKGGCNNGADEISKTGWDLCKS